MTFVAEQGVGTSGTGALTTAKVTPEPGLGVVEVRRDVEHSVLMAFGIPP